MSESKGSKGEGHGGPARGYRWEPFKPGNTAGEKSGAFSERKISPLADQLAAAAREAIPYLASDDFDAAVAAWSRAEAQAQLVFDWVDRHGVIGEDGKPTVSLDWLIRFERLAAEQRARLGLDPTSRVRLEKDLAAIGAARFDLTALAAEGKKAIAARKALNGEGGES